LNRKQQRLYKSLETLSCAILTLSDVEDIVKELNEKEIQEVVDKFSEKITKFDLKDLFRDSYAYEPIANTILSEIASKLEIEDY
jgi:chemotaxis methyl-accepting protein methylase